MQLNVLVGVNHDYSDNSGSFLCVSVPHSTHRSLTEDVETHEMEILKEQKELEDETQSIELKEVCV